jgi:ribosomal protein L20A (L18A)
VAAAAGVGTTPKWTVEGSFYARRNYWQKFRKECDTQTELAARDWALSEIGSCHHVKRHQIRIDRVSPEAAP